MSRPGDVQVVQDAVAFATASVDGDVDLAVRLACSALDTDPTGFLDALAATVTTLADVTVEHGGDPEQALRELGLGIEIAILAELAPSSDGPEHPRREGGTDTDGQEEQDRP
jgi:hypothetical protein